MSLEFDANAVVYGSQLYTHHKHNVIDIVLEVLSRGGDPRRACARCDRWDGFKPGTLERAARQVSLETAARPPGLLGRSVEEALTPAQTRWVAAMMELWRESPWGSRERPPIARAAEMANITEARSRLYWSSPRYQAIRQEFEQTRADDVRQSCHGCYASFFEQERSPGETEARFRELKAWRQVWKATLAALTDHDAQRENITHPRSRKVWQRQRNLLEQKLKTTREELLKLDHDPLKVGASGGMYV